MDKQVKQAKARVRDKQVAYWGAVAEAGKQSKQEGQTERAKSKDVKAARQSA